MLTWRLVLVLRLVLRLVLVLRLAHHAGQGHEQPAAGLAGEEAPAAPPAVDAAVGQRHVLQALGVSTLHCRAGRPGKAAKTLGMF